MRFIMLSVILCMLVACSTVRRPTGDVIYEHQKRVIELENTNRNLEQRIGQYDQLVELTVSQLEAVRTRAQSIRDSADRIEYLFGEYEKAVQRLVQQLREEREKSSTDTVDN